MKKTLTACVAFTIITCLTVSAHANRLDPSFWLGNGQMTSSNHRGFEQYTFYQAQVDILKTNAPPSLNDRQYEVMPPYTSDCGSISILPGNGCHVDIFQADAGIPIVSEISIPSRDLSVTNLGMHSSMQFNPNSGRISLFAETPEVGADEFKAATSQLIFTREFVVTQASRWFEISRIEASTIGEIAGGGADISLSISPSLGGPTIWEFSRSLRKTDSTTAPRQRLDLLQFVQPGTRVTLSVNLYFRAVSATVDIQEDPLLGAKPSSASIDFRISAG